MHPTVSLSTTDPNQVMSPWLHTHTHICANARSQLLNDDRVKFLQMCQYIYMIIEVALANMVDNFAVWSRDWNSTPCGTERLTHEERQQCLHWHHWQDSILKQKHPQPVYIAATYTKPDPHQYQPYSHMGTTRGTDPKSVGHQLYTAENVGTNPSKDVRGPRPETIVPVQKPQDRFQPYSTQGAGHHMKKRPEKNSQPQSPPVTPLPVWPQQWGPSQGVVVDWGPWLRQGFRNSQTGPQQSPLVTPPPVSPQWWQLAPSPPVSKHWQQAHTPSRGAFF